VTKGGVLMSVIKEVEDRINNMNEGEIFTTFDFSDLSNRTTIRKYLGRCCESKKIKRVFDGVYEKPKFSHLLKEYVPTDPEKIAYALAKTYHWSIAPCGDIALNKLGLTTQVPVIWSYVSDGPYRTFEWENIILKFKHRTNREISDLSEQTILLIEALRALGKENIDEKVINHLRNILSDNDKSVILKESTTCSEWIFETIRKVCTG
jgi:hypothetical protein